MLGELVIGDAGSGRAMFNEGATLAPGGLTVTGSGTSVNGDSLDVGALGKGDDLDYRRRQAPR
jgi:hypothetical protein